MDEREQDLLQVQAGVERAGGAHDGAVLDRAGGAARVGLQAREAGGGLVGEQLGGLDRRPARSRGGRSSATIRTWRISSSQLTGTNSAEAMPCSRRGPGRSPCSRARRRPRAAAGLEHALGPGRAARRSAGTRRRRRASLRAARSWLMSQYRTDQRRGGPVSALERAEERRRRGRRAASRARRLSGRVASALMSGAMRRACAFPGVGVARLIGGGGRLLRAGADPRPVSRRRDSPRRSPRTPARWTPAGGGWSRRRCVRRPARRCRRSRSACVPVLSGVAGARSAAGWAWPCAVPASGSRSAWRSAWRSRSPRGERLAGAGDASARRGRPGPLDGDRRAAAPGDGERAR